MVTLSAGRIVSLEVLLIVISEVIIALSPALQVNLPEPEYEYSSPSQAAQAELL